MTIQRLSARPLAALLFALAAAWIGPPAVLADRPGDSGFVQIRGASFPIEESAGHVDVVVRRHRGDTGAVKTYTNALGAQSPATTEVNAFACK